MSILLTLCKSGFTSRSKAESNVAFSTCPFVYSHDKHPPSYQSNKTETKTRIIRTKYKQNKTQRKKNLIKLEKSVHCLKVFDLHITWMNQTYLMECYNWRQITNYFFPGSCCWFSSRFTISHQFNKSAVFSIDKKIAPQTVWLTEAFDYTLKSSLVLLWL